MTDDDKELPWLEPALEDPAEGGFLEHYRMAIIAAGIFVIVAFALVIWQVYSGGGVQPGGEVPLVKAEDGPEKVKPEEPGGMEIPDRDKLIYGQAAGQQDDSATPHLRPGPEAPMDKPVPEAAPVAQSPATQSPAVQTPAPQSSAQLTTLPRQQVSEAQVPPAKVPVAPVAAAPKSVPAAAKPAPAPHKDIVVVPRSLFSSSEKPAPAPAPAPAAAGEGYLIQLGAFSDKAKALAVWQQIQAKFPGVITKLQPEVIALDRGSKGVLYRLQAGKIAEREKANELCTTLKAKSQPCMVVHR